MRALILTFPIKVVGAFFLLLVLIAVEILSFSDLERGDLSLDTVTLLYAGIVFLAIQVLFSIGLSNEAIAVWDYVATLTGAVAALIFVLGGISYMGNSYKRDALPLVEDRLDDAIGFYEDFQMGYCIVTPPSPVSPSTVEPGGGKVNATPIAHDDPEIAYMCERAKEISVSLTLLDRPANAVQVSQLYHSFIESLPDHMRFLGDRKPLFEDTPQSTFRQGASLVSRTHRMLSRAQRFTESGELLALFQNLTKGPYQLIWGLLLWNAASLKCGIILAKRR